MKARKLMVAYQDPGGAMRAYAVGSEQDAEEVRERALQELQAYCSRDGAGSYRGLKPNDFTVREEIIPASCI